MITAMFTPFFSDKCTVHMPDDPESPYSFDPSSAENMLKELNASDDMTYVDEHLALTVVDDASYQYCYVRASILDLSPLFIAAVAFNLIAHNFNDYSQTYEVDFHDNLQCSPISWPECVRDWSDNVYAPDSHHFYVRVRLV